MGPFASADSTGPVQVPFPGSPAGADALFTPASNAVLGRFMIYASLHPDTCGGGRLFNVADHATPTTYRELWPKLAQWYGLVGVVEGGDKGADSKALAVGQMPEDKGVPPGEYVEAHRAAFAECGRPGAAERGVGAGSRQLDSVGYWLTFDRQLSLDRLRATGFEGDRDPLTGWLDSFDMFRRAGLSL